MPRPGAELPADVCILQAGVGPDARAAASPEWDHISTRFSFTADQTEKENEGRCAVMKSGETAGVVVPVEVLLLDGCHPEGAVTRKRLIVIHGSGRHDKIDYSGWSVVCAV